MAERYLTWPGGLVTCIFVAHLYDFKRCPRLWKRDANMLAYIFGADLWIYTMLTGVYDDGGEMLTCLLIFLMPT